MKIVVALCVGVTAFYLGDHALYGGRHAQMGLSFLRAIKAGFGW